MNVPHIAPELTTDLPSELTAELAASARDLAGQACGRVVLPGDPGYDTARTGWNRTVDSRPTVVVEATGVDDVLAAVRVTRRRGVDLALQATGHGTLVPADGRVLLTTTAMGRVHVDPERRVARVDPGTTWHQVNAATTRYGLGSLAGRCGTVGVTGYTVGGGAGWLARTHGYAADSVVSADVVLADGRLVTADHDRHPDLFWAIRGGSGNFGIVTSLTFRLYPAAQVWGGMSFYPAEVAHEVLAAYRDWTTDEPPGMNTAVLLMHLPPAPWAPEPLRGRRVVAVRVLTLEDEATARRRVAPLLRAAGAPLHDGFAVRDFDAASRATNGGDAPPMPHRQLVHLFDELPDDLLDALVRDGFGPQSPFAFVELRHWRGAMAEPGADAGPAGHRDTPWSVMAVAPYPGPDRAATDARVDDLDRTLARRATGGSFLTLLTEPDRTDTAFTPANLARLREIKRAYDPDCFFTPSHTIRPASPATDPEGDRP
jgi:FAD/FMN-containing dehydrogenase